MLAKIPHEGSLVLYKGHPARVQRAGEKLDLLLPEGETAKVRPKDVTLLHPGPMPSLADLRTPRDGEVQAAWEILAGGSTDLAELAELIYGAYTPATAWAAWELVADGLYFRGTPEEITAATAEELSGRQAARYAEAAERRAWDAFLAHVRAGRADPDDARYLREIEALALGRSARSRALQALGKEESPESAHALLLKLGYWDETVDPYPARLDVTTVPPAEPLPDLPDEARRELTGLVAVAIDDVYTETPDDALSLDGNRLWVHVSDPAAIVLPGSALDREARARGASLYLPEGTVPMLPEAATDRFGLGLTDLSPALSFGLDVNPDGSIAGFEVAPSWVRVTRLSYEEAEARIEDDALLRGLYEIALRWQARRREAGAIMIQLPEADVRVRQGEVLVRPVLPLRSRVIVEEAMIAAGEAVARFAIENGIPMPYAGQDAPDEKPQAETLSEMFALRRTLKPRRYQTTPAPHAGLGLAAYVQATSPMRRYLDLVSHQQLRAFLSGSSLLEAGDILERIGEVEATGGSLRQAERLADQHWTGVFLIAHPGWQGEGILADRRGMSGTFLLPELALETRVHLSTDLPLDSHVTLVLTGVDLPRLDPRFRIK